MFKPVCQLERGMDVLTVNGGGTRCCGVRIINLGICNVHLVNVEVLVIDRKQIEFNFFRINIIKTLDQ